MVAHDLLRTWFVATKTRKTHAAERLDMSRQAVHNILNGAMPKADKFEAIATMTTDVHGFCAVPAYAWFVIGWEDSDEGKACIGWANRHGARIRYVSRKHA